MKYVIYTIGILIIGLRAFGVPIDLTSIGLYVLISIIVSLRDLNQLSEFSGFGLKFKFNKELKELSKSAEEIENKLEYRDQKEKGLSGLDEAKIYEGDIVDHFEKLIGTNEFKPDFSNPNTALIETAIEIEKILRSISNKVLERDNKYPIAPRKIVSELHTNEYINNDIFMTFEKFWSLRNTVVHGLETKYIDSQIVSLVDSGLKILNILRSIDNNISKGLAIRLLN